MPSTPIRTYASSTARTAFTGDPNQSFRRTTFPLEVGRGEPPIRTDPFQHPLRDVLVVVEHLLPAGAATDTEPRELARRHERKPLVIRLDDLAAFVQVVTPSRVIACDPRVQNEIMAAARHLNPIELDRTQPPQNLEHSLWAAR